MIVLGGGPYRTRADAMAATASSSKTIFFYFFPRSRRKLHTFFINFLGGGAIKLPMYADADRDTGCQLFCDAHHLSPETSPLVMLRLTARFVALAKRVRHSFGGVAFELPLPFSKPVFGFLRGCSIAVVARDAFHELFTCLVLGMKHLPACPAGVEAARLQLVVDGDTPIEHVAFTIPHRLIFRNFFEVFQDPAF